MPRYHLKHILVIISIMLILVSIGYLFTSMVRRFTPAALPTSEDYLPSEAIQAQQQQEQQDGIYYRKLIRGNPSMRAVALTFDDGPHPIFTLQLLEVLAKYRVPATFFVVGKMAERYPELLMLEYASGHLIGNHTYHHVNLRLLTSGQVRWEWEACNATIYKMTRYRMRYCRPPGGDYNAAIINAAMSLGLTTVLWTDDPGDYAQPGDTVISERVFKHLGNGGIILLHDGEEQTISILPQLIEGIAQRGYRFITLDEMEQQMPKF